MAETARVTQLLRAWNQGDAAALDELLLIVEGELRRLARRYMAGERQGHTLQPTALINEMYVRLVDVQNVQWQNRPHFIAVCARLMRRVLVDAARTRGASKRGGQTRAVAFDERLVPLSGGQEELLALDEALNRLAETGARRSQIVELRVFGGLTIEESAKALQVSKATVMRDWRFARAWLARELKGSRPGRA